MPVNRDNPLLNSNLNLTRRNTENDLGVTSAVATVPLKFAYDFLKFGGDVGDYLAGNEEATFDSYWEIEEKMTGRKRSNASKMTSEILTLIGGTKAVAKGAQFGVKAFKGAGTVEKLNKFRNSHKITTAVVESSIADFIWSSPDAPRISDIIKEHAPSVHNSFTEYLSTDGDDSIMEARLKNAIEGGILGAGAEVLGKLLFGTAKHLKGKGNVLGEGADDLFKSAGFDTSEVSKLIDLDDIKLHKVDEVETATVLAREMGLIDDVIKSTDDITDDITEETAERAVRGLSPEEITPKLAQDLVQTGKKLKSVANQKTLGDLAPEQIDSTMRTLAEKFSKQLPEITGKGVRSLDDITKEANDFVKSLGAEDQLRVGLAESAEKASRLPIEVVVYKSYMQAKQRVLSESAETILKKGWNEATDQDLLTLLAKADEASDALAKFLKIKTGTSHALMAHKIKPLKGFEKKLTQLSGKELAQESVQKQIKEIAKDFTGGKALRDDPRVQQLVRAISDTKGDLQLTAKAVANASKDVGLLDVIKELRMTSMLSGFSTHAVNLTGNSLMLGFKALQRLAGATMSIPARVLGEAGDDIITFREVGAYVSGMMDMTPDVLKAVASDSDKLKEALIRGPVITGKNFNKAFPNMPLGNVLGSVIDGYGKVSRGLSFGVLGKADNFFQNRGMTMTLNGLVERYGRRIATATGRSFDDVASKLKADVGEVLNGNITRVSGKGAGQYENILQSIASEVQRTAKEVTFQRDLSGLAKQAQRALAGDNKPAKLVNTFVIPFFKTPVNIVREVAEMTPFVGRHMDEMRRALSGADGEVARKLAQGKIVVGTALYTTAGALVLSGKVTGRHDPRERALKEEAGIPEYSININGSWYQYNRLDPLGMFLGLTADVINISEQSGGDFTSIPPAMLLSLSSNLINKTYLKGLSDFLKATEDPNKMSKFMKNAIRPVLNPIEGAQRTVLHFVDDAERRDVPKEINKFQDFVDTMWANNILHRPSLQVSVDMLGNDKVREATGLKDWTTLLGIKRTETSQSNAMREISRLRARMPDRSLLKIQGVKMTMEEQNQFLRSLKSDFNLEGFLNDFIESPEYLQLSDEERTKVIKSIITKFRSGAKKKFLADNPEFVNEVIRFKEEQLQLLLDTQGSTQNIGTKADIVYDDLLQLNKNSEFQRSED